MPERLTRKNISLLEMSTDLPINGFILFLKSFESLSDVSLTSANNLYRKAREKSGIDYKRFTPDLPVVSVDEPTNTPLRYELFSLDGKKYLLQAAQFGPQLVGEVRKYKPLANGKTRVHVKREKIMDEIDRTHFYDWMSRFWTGKLDAQAER